MTDEQLLERINQIVASQLEPIKATQQEHSAILQEYSKSLKTVKARVRKIDKTQDIVIRMFDERIVKNSRYRTHKRSSSPQFKTLNLKTLVS